MQDETDISNEFDQFLQRNLKFDEMRVKKAGLFFPYSVIERIKISVETLMKREIKLSEIIMMIIKLSQKNKKLYFIEQKSDFINFTH